MKYLVSDERGERQVKRYLGTFGHRPESHIIQRLDPAQIRSTVARHLGMKSADNVPLPNGGVYAIGGIGEIRICNLATKYENVFHWTYGLYRD